MWCLLLSISFIFFFVHRRCDRWDLWSGCTVWWGGRRGTFGYFNEVKCSLTELTTRSECSQLLSVVLIHLRMRWIPRALGCIAYSSVWWAEGAFCVEHLAFCKFFPSLPSLACVASVPFRQKDLRNDFPQTGRTEVGARDWGNACKKTPYFWKTPTFLWLTWHIHTYIHTYTFIALPEKGFSAAIFKYILKILHELKIEKIW